MTTTTASWNGAHNLVAAQDAFTSEGVRLGTGAQARQDSLDQQRLMIDLGVHHVGHHYLFLGYRYDRAEDAIAYALLVRSRASQHLAEDRPSAATVFPAEDQQPGLSEEILMASLNISYEAGRYRFATFSYSSLVDAVSYARRQHLP